MSGSIFFPIVATLFSLSVASITYAFRAVRPTPRKARSPPELLPKDLPTWRNPGPTPQDGQKIWNSLEKLFRSRGFTLWPHSFFYVFTSPGRTYPCATGFQYAIPGHMREENWVGTVGCLREFEISNALSSAARTSEGHDVVVRVIVIGNEGHEHLKILRRFATGEKSLISTSHILPMFQEVQFDDITFGIFPKVGGNTVDAYNCWAKNSVGDVIDMIMQSLEALAFIHEHRIAHRDAFHDNFLVQWHPESLLTNSISVSRPRVYLIDFEVAVEFPEELPEEHCVSTGFPTGGSFSLPGVDASSEYARPHAPEFTSGKPYSPFKLDVWQYGKAISNFKTTIPEIDKILTELTEPDPVQRLSSRDALDGLAKAVYSLPPTSLHISPLTTEPDW